MELTAAERLECYRYRLMLLDHKNVWSKQDREDREWLREKIEEMERCRTTEN
jgi:hypothetical protein